MSTRTIVRSLRPLGTNFPFWVRVYLVKCVGVEPLGGMVLEPAHPEDAGSLGMGDALAVGVQLDVIADAPTEGAGRVLHNRQFHFLFPFHRLIWPSEPDGMTNAQPSARPL